MSKFARLTIEVPVDEALHVSQLRDHLKGTLEERGIESLTLPPKETNGEMLVDADRAGRVYWPAAIVKFTVEKPPNETKPGRRPRA